DIHRPQRGPVLRVLRLELHEVAENLFRLAQPLRRQKGMTPRPPHERMVSGMAAGMAQQPLGIPCLPAPDGHGCETRERREMTRIGLQNFTEDPFRGTVVAAGERGRRFLDALPLRVEESRLLEGEARIREPAHVDEHIAMSEPGGLQRRLFLQYPPQLRVRCLEASILTIGPCEIDARVQEAGCVGNDTLENFQGGSELALREQRHCEQMQAVDLAGARALDLPQLTFSGPVAPEP